MIGFNYLMPYFVVFSEFAPETFLFLSVFLYFIVFSYLL